MNLCRRIDWRWVVLGGCSAVFACADTTSSDLGASDASSVITTFDAGTRALDASSREPSAVDGSDIPSGGDARVVVAERCDGIDNDGDGNVDNVDVAGDGVCDCLLLATLGAPGTWGSGNVFDQWLSARSNVGAVSLSSQELTESLLAKYQVIVAQDLRLETYSDAEVAALQDWVRRGGGLFALIGYGAPDERANINRILSATGVQYAAAASFAPTGSGTSPIAGWKPHPVAQGVTRLGAATGYQVTGSGTVVADQAGQVALRVADLGDGHVLAWGDEWITYDSEWVDHPEYQVERFWLNSIKWLTSAKKCQVPIIFL